jgi:hypothetical protein
MKVVDALALLYKILDSVNPFDRAESNPFPPISMRRENESGARHKAFSRDQWDHRCLPRRDRPVTAGKIPRLVHLRCHGAWCARPARRAPTDDAQCGPFPWSSQPASARSLGTRRRALFGNRLYMIADTAAKEVSFANAGHPDPLRLGRQAGIVEPLSDGQVKTGPALGLFDSAAYPTSRSSFDNADCIVLFTDGLYELYSPQGNEFGRSALVSTFLRYEDLSAEKLCAAVLKDVSGFADRSDFDDDVCIVTVERAAE